MSSAVVITGVGICSPLGTTRKTNWQNLIQSATQRVRVNWQLDEHTGTPHEPRSIGAALRMATEALEDAGWPAGTIAEPERWGCVIGTSKGPLDLYDTLADKTDGQEPVPFPALWPSGPAAAVARQFGFRGPLLTPVSACATGLDAVIRGVRLIEQGDCDFVLAGSVDASRNRYVTASYRRLGILSRQTPEETACRPFDVTRDGFVIGEGGAMFVLARENEASSRTRKPYARWHSGLQLNDPSGMTQLDPTAAGLIHLIRQLLDRARLDPGQLDALHLHGTGTLANDACEARAVNEIFGPVSQQPLCTASKGSHGHLLGAAGSLELAWLLLAMREGLLPPVQNLQQLATECPIRVVQETAVSLPIQYGMKISLGFGGHISGALLEAIH
ncbi:MAG: beta-ketoacyl-[acyl-carrier-protein] synthase family protein [Planctomycetaceae bacterium]|nr:beta-ketoacyl-[acyl-carrier-protein] synthase family protein [Planctomycetaceae bacterium]